MEEKVIMAGMGWLVDVGEMKNKNVTYKKTKNGRCTMM